jgi:hypothetical protein
MVSVDAYLKLIFKRRALEQAGERGAKERSYT